jgi:hypothetical protein
MLPESAYLHARQAADATLKNPNKASDLTEWAVWPTVLGALIGTVITAAAITTSIFFEPGVLALLFFTSVCTLHGGVWGVALAGIVAGTAVSLVGGLVGYGIAKLIQGLANNAKAPEVHVTLADLQAEEQQDENPSAAPGQEQSEEPPQPDQLADQPPSPQDESVHENTLAQIAEEVTPGEVPEKLPDDSSEPKVSHGGISPAALQRVQLKKIPEKSPADLCKPASRRELLKQEVAAVSFDGTVPDKAVDPTAYAEYEARVDWAVAAAEAQDANDSALGTTIAQSLTQKGAQQKCDAARKKIEDLKIQRHLVTEMANLHMDGPTLLEKMRQLEQLRDLRARDQRLQESLVAENRIADGLQELDITDPQNVASFMKACNAMLDVYSPHCGTQIPETAKSNLFSAIHSIRRDISALPAKIQQAKEALTSEGKSPGNFPGINKVLSTLTDSPTHSHLRTIDHRMLFTCHQERKQLQFKNQGALGELLTAIEDVREKIMKIGAAKAEGIDELSARLFTAENPEEFLSKLKSLHDSMQSRPKEFTNKAELDAELEKCRMEIERRYKEIGGDKTVEGVEKLLGDIGCRNDQEGRQIIGEHLGEIAKRQEPAAPPEAATGPTGTAKTEPQTEDGKWLALQKKYNFDRVRIGTGADIAPDKIEEFKVIINYLVFLAEEGQFPLDPNLFEGDSDFARLASELNGGGATLDEVCRKTNEAIRARNPDLLMQAFFEEESW